MSRGRPKVGKWSNVPLGELHRKLAEEEAEKTGESVKELEKLYNTGFSEKMLSVSDSELKQLIEQKCSEMGVDVEKIRKINKRINEIDDLPQKNRELCYEEKLNLISEIEKKMAVVFREILRIGFIHRDLCA